MNRRVPGVANLRFVPGLPYCRLDLNRNLTAEELIGGTDHRILDGLFDRLKVVRWYLQHQFIMHGAQGSFGDLQR